MGEEDLCRLCAETRPMNDLLNVKDDYWIKEDLESKITQFFQIKILPSDKLPKSVCYKCCEKVKHIWEFNEIVQQAQKTLRSVVSDDETEIEAEIEAEVEADYESDHPSASETMKSEKQLENPPPPPVEFVECILNETNQTKLKSEDTETEAEDTETKVEVLSDEEVMELETTSRRKRKLVVKPKNMKMKRRPGRPKGRKIRKKFENDNETEDDNMSVLSGASEAERHEDGSLILRNPLETWDSYPWMCVDCNEKLNTVVDLRSHHQSAHKQMPKYVCVECPKMYTKYYGFITHVRTHRNHLKFCCDACNKFFANKKQLEAHRACHFDSRPFVCSTCGKNFRMQSALCVHERSHLPLEVKNKYPCDQCPKRFGTKPNLMAHKRIHTGVRDYTCDQCGKSFIQKGNLDNHMLTHIAARPYSCETCGKAFKTLMRLKKHGSVHSGLKPHQCDVCGRQFRERGTLKEHHRIHTGAMPFTCEFCGKCFRFKGVLTTHRRQHTGERPYSCQECQHHFTNWPNYNKHMKRRHGINTSVTTRKPQAIPPTGMPHRNPPGTIVNSSGQVIVIQDSDNVQNASAYVEHEQQIVTQNVNVINPTRNNTAATNIATTPLVNVQPAHLTMQNYYMYMYQ